MGISLFICIIPRELSAVVTEMLSVRVSGNALAMSVEERNRQTLIHQSRDHHIHIIGLWLNKRGIEQKASCLLLLKKSFTSSFLGIGTASAGSARAIASTSILNIHLLDF